jgi:hypothetical protein
MTHQDRSGLKIDQQRKTCFVISPIGPEDSVDRNYADLVFEFIIRPVAEKHSYTPIRADHIFEPGIITSDIVARLVSDDLVIADLTGSNPNVTYELAIRHAVNKPVIQIKGSNESLPFDIQGMRTVYFVYGNAKSMISCRNDISKYIESIEADPSRVDSPIAQYVSLQAWKKSDDPNKEYFLQLQSQIQTLISRVDTMETRGLSQKVVQSSESLPTFSGQTIIRASSPIPGMSLSGVIPGQSLGNVILDPSGKPGQGIRLKFDQTDPESNKKQ